MRSPARAFTLALLVAAAFTAGCKKKKSDDAAGKAGASAATADLGPMTALVAEVHQGITKFRNEMCACTTVRCGDDVVGRMGSWLNDTRFAEVDKQSTPAQIEAAKKISAEFEACARKLTGR